MSGQVLADGQWQNDHACSGALSVCAHMSIVESWLFEWLQWSRAGVLHIVHDVGPISLSQLNRKRRCRLRRT